MKIEKFHVLMEELKKLTPRQQEFLEKHLNKTGQTQLVNTLIESRTNVTPTCPKCGHDKIARWGLSSRLQRYRAPLAKSPLMRCRNAAGAIAFLLCPTNTRQQAWLALLKQSRHIF